MKNLIKISGDLRLNELQNLAENTLQIVAPFDVLADSKLVLTEKLALFVDGMEKTKTKQDRKEMDHIRDNISGGLASLIKANNVLFRLPTYESSVASQDTLMQIYNTHAIGISKMRYDEETTAIENYIAQLKTLSDEFLTLSNIATWIPLLETANDNFKNFSLEKISLITEEDKTIAASNMANDLKTALNDLYTVMFAQVVISPTTELEDAYGELSTMLDLL